MKPLSRIEKGLTLFELLISLAIISILIAFSLSDFSEIMTQQQAKSRISDVRRLLYYARTAAISRNKTVIVCASIDGKTCNKNKDWSEKNSIGFY